MATLTTCSFLTEKGSCTQPLCKCVNPTFGLDQQCSCKHPAHMHRVTDSKCQCQFFSLDKNFSKEYPLCRCGHPDIFHKVAQQATARTNPPSINRMEDLNSNKRSLPNFFPDNNIVSAKRIAHNTDYHIPDIFNPHMQPPSALKTKTKTNRSHLFVYLLF